MMAAAVVRLLLIGKREFLKAGDMWSVGVILYILLSGYPPFYHENTTHKHILVLRAQYDFNDPVWATVTESAKSLVQSLLTKDPAARLTAADVVVHPWVRPAPHLPRWRPTRRDAWP